MEEHGFYHPEGGYWQTTSEPSEAIRASYPEGTVEVPTKPDADYEWQYEGDDPTKGEWVYVAPPEPEPIPRRIGTSREFLELFSEEEQVAFFTAEQSNPHLKLWWAKASTGEFSLDHESVAPGLAYLVQLGILTQERAAEIRGADFDAVP